MSSYFPQVGDFVMIRPWDDMVKELALIPMGISQRFLSPFCKV